MRRIARTSLAPFFKRVNTRNVSTFAEKFSRLKTVTNDAESFLQQLESCCNEAKFDEAYKILGEFWSDNHLGAFQKGVYPRIRGEILKRQLQSTGELDKIFETDPFKAILSQNKGYK